MIKVFPPRFEPDWLASVSEEHPLPLSDLRQNSLYYPASRLDGDPVRYFAGFLHSFVYADSSISKEAITEDLYRRGHGFTGYRVRFCKDVSNSIKAGGSTPADQAVKDTYALWVVLERLEKVDSSRGPSRFSFLFVGGKGVSVYERI
jgi:hypothetical protein